MEIDELPLGKAEDLKGQKFGKLMVLYRVKPPEHVKNKVVYWKCKCDCGKIHITQANSLKKGQCTSCGCNKGPRPENAKVIDETGNQYGLLTVIERAGSNRTGQALWKCKCKCGNETIVEGTRLRYGDTKSCGCLIGKNNVKLILPGTRFGHLTVLQRVGSKDNRAIYKCRCDCGNITIVSSNALKRGNTQSCGCIRLSKGEEKIMSLLQKNNISYIREFSFSNCKSIKNYKIPFDFYVNNTYLIEYDGIQHTEPAFGQESFEITQRNDKVKNEYCKTHNIPLIRIPYTHYDKITIDDLRPETSQFLIT